MGSYIPQIEFYSSVELFMEPNSGVPTLAAVLALAAQLSPDDQLRLMVFLAEAVADRGRAPAGTSTYGLLADLGPAPSAEDIDEVRREMWANFPRDID